MKLMDLFEEKLTWSQIAKKYNIVNGPRFYDSGGSPKLIKNDKGVILADIMSLDKNKYIVDVDKLASPQNKGFRSKELNLAELDQFLSTLKLDAQHPLADDATICKFISREYILNVKNVNDLKENWAYIKWPQSIQMVDHDNAAVYTHIVSGSTNSDSESGLAPLGMNLAEFEAWLIKNGVKKKSKPKKIRSSSYYD
jgi:hypothetical protein